MDNGSSPSDIALLPLHPWGGSFASVLSAFMNNANAVIILLIIILVALLLHMAGVGIAR